MDLSPNQIELQRLQSLLSDLEGKSPSYNLLQNLMRSYQISVLIKEINKLERLIVNQMPTFI